MRVLVCGDRNWTDYELVLSKLREICEPEVKHLSDQHHRRMGPDHPMAMDMSPDFRKDILVIDGEAPGADTCGNRAAKKLGYSTRRFPANWKKFGNAAGPIRNQQQLDEGGPIDVALAFHDDLKNSKGTKDMIKRAEKARIKVIKVKH